MIFALVMVYFILHLDDHSTNTPVGSYHNSINFWKEETMPSSVPSFRPPFSHCLHTLQRLDLLGAVTLILAVSSLLIGLQRLSQMCYSITQIETFVPLLLSLTLFLLFLVVEFYITPNLFRGPDGKGRAEPILPMHIVGNPSLLAAYAANFFGVGASMSLFYHFSLYLQVVKGMSPSEAGAGLLPSVVGGAVGSLLAGLIMRRTGKFYWETIIGYGVLVIGCVIVAMGSGTTMTSLIMAGKGDF